MPVARLTDRQRMILGLIVSSVYGKFKMDEERLLALTLAIDRYIEGGALHMTVHRALPRNYHSKKKLLELLRPVISWASRYREYASQHHVQAP